jgi:rsbT co-antagonist protein RsbR
MGQTWTEWHALDSDACAAESAFDAALPTDPTDPPGASVATSTGIGTLLKDNEASILREWVGLQLADSTRRELLSESEVNEQSRAFLASLSGAWQQERRPGHGRRCWDDVRAALSELSKNRAHAGFSPSETATFVFSLKGAMFAALRRTHVATPSA